MPRFKPRNVFVEERSLTPSTYRAGDEGKQMGQGASLATHADSLVQRQGFSRSTSDGKQWQENPWCRPRNLGHTRKEDTGRTSTQAWRQSGETVKRSALYAEVLGGSSRCLLAFRPAA
jgi:hypothetical protein